MVPFCQLSIRVSSSVSAKQQIPWSVSFLPWWEDCFFHQGQRQVANWAVAASPIPPPLHFFFSQPPSNAQTYQPMHWHSHKREHAKPPNVHQSLFPHQIHKVYLNWALTQREHFPIVSPLWGNTNKQLWIQAIPTRRGFHTLIRMGCTSYGSNP